MAAHRATQMGMVRTQTSCSAKYCDSMSTLLIPTQFQRIIHLEMRSGHMVYAIPGASHLTALQAISILQMLARTLGRRSIFSLQAPPVAQTLAGTFAKGPMIIRVVGPMGWLTLLPNMVIRVVIALSPADMSIAALCRSGMASISTRTIAQA